MKRKGYGLGILLAAMLLASGCAKDAGPSREEYRMQGIAKMESGSYEEAVVDFNLAIENSDGFVRKFELDVLKYRGEAEYRSGDYEAAANTYSILLEVDKELAEYLNMRSLAYTGLGDWEKALEDYTRSNALEKNAYGSEEALLSLGQLLETNDEFEKAMQMYNQAVTDGVHNSALYNRMGICMMDEGNYDEALGYFNLGMQAGDGDVMDELLFNQAVAYERMGEFGQALTLFEQYANTYGSTEEVSKEIAFLKTR